MDETRPQSCQELGLECRNCTEEAARHTAAVCGGLGGEALRRVFFQIFADPGCAPMRDHFAACYREAAGLRPIQREAARAVVVAA